MLARGLRLSWRQRVDAITALAFFLLVCALFPLVLMPEPQSLRGMAPGVAWVAALLAIVLGSLRLFSDDAGNGVLEQILLSTSPVAAVGGVLVAHWATVALPLLVVAPLMALLYDLSLPQTGRLLVSLALGTPALCVLTALGAALSVHARAGGLLLALIVLPWCVPVLLFGVRAAQGDTGTPWSSGSLLLLASTLTASVAIGPAVVTSALNVVLE